MFEEPDVVPTLLRTASHSNQQGQTVWDISYDSQHTSCTILGKYLLRIKGAVSNDPNLPPLTSATGFFYGTYSFCNQG